MKNDKNKGKMLIRNSTTEFLIFTGQAGEQSIEARYEDETVWLARKLEQNGQKDKVNHDNI